VSGALRGKLTGTAMRTARPADYTSRIEASRACLAASRGLCRNTAEIIQQTRITIEISRKKLNRQLEIVRAGKQRK